MIKCSYALSVRARAREGPHRWKRLTLMSKPSIPPHKQLWSALLWASLLGAAGCMETGEYLPSIGGGESYVPRGEPGPCEEGETRACGETLEYESGVMTCFRGTQTCVSGEYGPCENGVITTEAAPPLRPARTNREALSISSPATCDDPMSPAFNVCDPGCRFFDEDPPDIIATPYVPPVPPTYNGNPVSTICNADPCTASAMPLDDGCSDCVSDVCDVTPSCCTTAWTQECVNSALLICHGITVPDVPGLCGFGLYSDNALTTANRPATNAVIGSYGDITVGTDADLQGGGIVTAGNITFNSLNGNDIKADRGIYAGGNITSQDSDTTLTGNMSAGGTMFLPKWNLAAGYTVGAHGNISGQNGTQSFGSVRTRGSISNITLNGTSCSGMMGCYTHSPPADMQLPPQTAGTAVPTLTTNCTGTTDFIQSGGTRTINGPGVYRDVNITNDGNLVLNGEGTYYFRSFYVNGGYIRLDPNMGGAVGWDIRVCNNVGLDNGTYIRGGTGLTNDVLNVLLDPTLLTFYANTSNPISMGTDVFFSGIFMAPNATVNKANINAAANGAGTLDDQPPHRIDIGTTAGKRAAPINGAIWARTLNVGTSGLTYQMPEATCEGLAIPGTVDTPGVYAGSCPISNVLPASPAAFVSPCQSGADCQMNYRCANVDTAGACNHSKCTTGAALNASCDRCVAQICAATPSCCTTSWTAACVAQVDTVCDAVCGATESGTCTDNSDGYQQACGGFDLSHGIPCDNEVEICNHGNTSFFGDVTVGYWPNNDNQMASATPLMSPEGTCSATNLSIAAGRCAEITCAVPAGGYTLMVDPFDSLNECNNRRSDNWSVDDGRTCAASPVTTTRLEVEDYDAYANPAAMGTDAGRGGNVGFEVCSDTSGCGYHAGFLTAGDYIQWDYTAPRDGFYEIDVRLSSAAGAWDNTLQVDGMTVATLSGAGTGAWNVWRTFQYAKVYMTAGTHTIRLNPQGLGNYQNINYIEVHSPEIFDDTVVETHDYEAVCPDGTVALWGLLGWDADTPDGSTVTFEGVVAETAAELTTAMADPTAWAPLAVAQSQTPPSTESCSLSSSCVADITAELGLNANQGQFLGLRITVDPDIATTTLHDWVVTYSCVYDQ
jgi:hypothetical protein